MIVEILAMSMLAAQSFKNPTIIEFECIDHALDTGHEIQFVLDGATTGTVVSIGDPAARADGKIEVDISAHITKLPLGVYTLMVRALRTGVPSSDWSNTVPFDRALRQPSSLKIVR